MDRTAGNPDWMVVKPFVTQASNCILPVYVVAAMLKLIDNGGYGWLGWHRIAHAIAGAMRQCL